MDFALETNGAYEDVVSAATWAGDVGMAALALPDHYLPSLGADPAVPSFDTFMHLAGLARDTEAIELVMLVSAVTFRHPAVLLKMAVTLDHMSGGRFALGVGAGWLEREHELFGIPFPAIGERFEMLEEALGYLKAGLTSGARGFAGRRFALEAVDTAPIPAEPLRLVVGGVGAKLTPRLAGRYAGEYNVFPGGADQIRVRLDRAREAAEAAGRDFDQILISSAGQVLAAPSRTQFKERFAARAAEMGMEVEELESHYARRNTPRGTYEEVADQLAVMQALGVERFYFQWWTGFDREQASGLIEYLRKAMG